MMRRRLTSIVMLASVLLVAAPAVAQGDEGGGGDEGTEAAAEQEDEAAEAAGDEKTQKGESASTETDQGETAADQESSAEKEFSAPSVDEGSSVAATDTADETETAGSGGHPSTSNVFVAAPHVGVMVPQLFNDLGTWPIFSLEVGVIPPMESMNNPLELAVIGRYTQPGSGGGDRDPNLGETGGETYNWELTQRTVTLDVVGIWRGRNLAAKLDPYGLIGPRVNFMETTMTAQGNGSEFGEVRETNVEFGMVFGGGVDYQLGPGTLFGELKFGWSNLDQTLTGDTNAGAFTLDAGYRFYPF